MAAAGGRGGSVFSEQGFFGFETEEELEVGFLKGGGAYRDEPLSGFLPDGNMTLTNAPKDLGRSL